MPKRLSLTIFLTSIVLGVILSGCTFPKQSLPFVKTNKTTAQCSQDSDCAVGGCSKQVCGKKGEVESIVTTCEQKPEYSCLLLTNCACVNSKCKWRETLPYQTCVNKIR